MATTQTLTYINLCLALLPLNIISADNTTRSAPLSSFLNYAQLTSTASALEEACTVYQYNNEVFKGQEFLSLLEETHAIADGMLTSSSICGGNYRSYIENDYPVTSPILNQEGTLLAGVTIAQKGIAVIDMSTQQCSKYIAIDNVQSVDFGINNMLAFSTPTVVGITSATIIKENPTFEFEYHRQNRMRRDTTALAAHKTLKLVAIAHAPSSPNYAYSVVRILDYDFAELCTYKIAGIVKKNMLKWHPNHKIIAIKTKNDIHLYNLNNNIATIHTSVSPDGEFDFNEDGTQLCIGSRTNRFSYIDTETNLFFKNVGCEMIPSGIMRNLHKNLFIYQDTEYPHHLSLIKSRTLHQQKMTPTNVTVYDIELISTTIDDILPNKIIVPNKKTGQILLYKISNNTAEICCYTLPTMIGTRITSVKRHNLACIYALALARDVQDIKLLRSLQYKTVVDDTAEKDPIFKATLNSWQV